MNWEKLNKRFQYMDLEIRNTL